jgi:hypothetical protein
LYVQKIFWSSDLIKVYTQCYLTYFYIHVLVEKTYLVSNSFYLYIRRSFLRSGPKTITLGERSQFKELLRIFKWWLFLCIKCTILWQNRRHFTQGFFAKKNNQIRTLSPGVTVMVTIFNGFSPMFVEKMAFFWKAMLWSNLCQIKHYIHMYFTLAAWHRLRTRSSGSWNRIPPGYRVVYVERSSTIERYRQPARPPPKFGNNCQPRASSTLLPRARTRRDRTSAPGNWLFSQFFLFLCNDFFSYNFFQTILQFFSNNFTIFFKQFFNFTILQSYKCIILQFSSFAQPRSKCLLLFKDKNKQ